jgi:hypothetical protein
MALRAGLICLIRTGKQKTIEAGDGAARFLPLPTCLTLSHLPCRIVVFLDQVDQSPGEAGIRSIRVPQVHSPGLPFLIAWCSALVFSEPMPASYATAIIPLSAEFRAWVPRQGPGTSASHIQGTCSSL